tara:strand:- start:10254 stop:11381 length:1128 start_codon:yes stop_codon:yes gene_type:complete
MNIAVNTRLLLNGRLEGIGWFTKETLERIVKAHPEHNFYFFFDRTFDPKYIFAENVHPVVLSPQARHPILFLIWFEIAVKSALKKYKIDLFVSPDGYLSLSSKKPQLAVIHDINFELYPQFVPLGARLYLRYFFPKFAKKAKRIVTVSHFSKDELVKHYNTPAEKIDVVYNGVSTLYRPLPEKQRTDVRWHYTRGIPYFIYVGALQPRKNINHLLLAFDQFRQEYDESYKLIIVGEKKWWSKKSGKIFDAMKYKQDVLFTGRLDADELANVVGGATALTYISFYEGFGIPILEGMKAGVPVITSAVSSMPEVADNAALLVNPFDIEDIIKGMKKLASDLELQKTLRQKGIERAAHFSWEKAAKDLWTSIESCLKN